MESRKQFFRSVILCNLLTIYVSFNFGFVESVPIQNPRIVIIGAGPSGIAAASKLLENDFKNVTILEAENRIGGRVYTTTLGNYTVDLGGQWVHGVKGNVAYELANPYGLLEKIDEGPIAGYIQEYLDSDGKRVNENIENKINNFFFNKILDKEYGNDSSYASVGQYAEEEFDKDFKDDSEIYNDKKKYLHFLEMSTIGSDASETWHDVAAGGPHQYIECEGNQLVNWKTRGYSTILDILMKRYPDPSKELPVLKNTVLNAEVKSIDYSQNGEGSPITITTSNGQVYKADHVIVTVSLGVLKAQHESLFIPPLPENKVKTIRALGFGNAGKVYLLFDKPFWEINDNKRLVYFVFLWNDADRNAVEADPEKSWVLGMTGAFTVESKPNALEIWVSGKYAKQMEKLSEDKVLEHSVEVLRRFLGKQYNVSEPIAMLRTQWYSNPHFRGTYSYRSVESRKQNVYSDILEEPLSPQNLTVLFAGEAAAINRFSTVDGAIGAGWKAADRLIEHYKKTAVDN